MKLIPTLLSSALVLSLSAPSFAQNSQNPAGAAPQAEANSPKKENTSTKKEKKKKSQKKSQKKTQKEGEAQ